MRLFDAHCHLGFMDDPVAVARDAKARGIGVFCATVNLAEYERLSSLLAGFDNVVVGAGMHPWWLSGPEGMGLGETGAGEAGLKEMGAGGAAVKDAGTSQASLREIGQVISRTRFIGEVGLDFGPRHGAAREAREAQVAVFRGIAEACARQGGKTLSLHAVRSAAAVIDILEETGCVATGDSAAKVLAAPKANTCIFHWFSGTSDDLTRAIKAGCYFSVSERMLETKRGRAYVRAIPASRLLLETDAPPLGKLPFVGLPSSAVAWSAAGLEASLLRTQAALADIKGAADASLILETSRRIFFGR